MTFTILETMLQCGGLCFILNRNSERILRSLLRGERANQK